MHDKAVVRLGTEEEKQQLLCNYPNIRNVIHNDGYFVIAKIEDTIVGYLWAFQREIPAPVAQNELFINIIEVIYTDLRRQGMASAMLQELIKIAKEEKVYQVRAYCAIENMPSHRLWLKNKFSISPVKMPDGSIAGSFVSFVL